MRRYEYLAALCLALAVSNPSPAMAAPAYIDCSFDRGDGVILSISIAADEAAQEVTVTNHFNGKSKRFDAVFSPSSVSWAEKYGSATTEQNIVSRENLSFRRTTVSYTREVIDVINGACKVQVTPARAF